MLCVVGQINVYFNIIFKIVPPFIFVVFLVKYERYRLRFGA
jgi:hypothetical protein